MEAKIEEGYPFNLIIETNSNQKVHMRETDNIGALPEFDARSATSSLTSRSYVIQSTGGRKEALHVRTKSCSSIFGSILKPRRKQTEVQKTALEELLFKQISQLKTDHSTQVHELRYKLQQRESSIEGLEQALQTQQDTLIQFQNEIQNLKERLQDAEDRNHLLKKNSMQNSSRSINSGHSQTDDNLSRSIHKRGISEQIQGSTSDDISLGSSTNLSHHSCRGEITSYESLTANNSTTGGEIIETDQLHQSSHRRSFNSSHNRMKRQKGNSASLKSRLRNNDYKNDVYHSGAYNSEEVSCDESRGSIRSRRSCELRNSVRSQQRNSDLPDYKLYPGGLDEHEQIEKSKRLRQQSKMRALAKKAERGQPLSSKETNESDKKKERVSQRKTMQTANGRRSNDIVAENSVVSKDTEETGKISDVSSKS